MHKGYQLPQDMPLIIGVFPWLVYYGEGNSLETVAFLDGRSDRQVG